MSLEDRKEIFFLRVNDEMFKPAVVPNNKSIVTELYTENLEKAKFTDFQLDEKQIGYFIIAAPSTWPPFAAKINDLLSILENNASQVEYGYKVIFVYTAEAHSDDVWPAGYGINQTTSLEERLANCKGLMSKFSALHEKVDHVLIDNMNNDFINVTGAWLEGYIITDRDGVCQFKSSFTEDGVKTLKTVDDRIHQNIQNNKRKIKKERNREERRLKKLKEEEERLQNLSEEQME